MLFSNLFGNLFLAFNKLIVNFLLTREQDIHFHLILLIFIYSLNLHVKISKLNVYIRY